MWQFYAYGGGAIYSQVFNAVALMSGANAMDSLLRLALVLGLCMGLVKAVTDFNVGAILKWYLFAVVIYGVLWVPKVTIHVTDRLNPSAAYGNIANVPLGVGASAAIISQIGDRIIALTETSFADPADLTYSSHGMIFGAKMFSKISTLRISNQLVAQNTMSYMRNCAFYDVQAGVVDVNTLQNSTDIWQTLTASPNPARLAPYTNTDGSSVLKTCVDMAADVTNDLDVDKLNVQKVLYASLSADTPDANLASNEASVSSAIMAAIGSSQDSLNVIRNAMVRNSLNDSLKGFMGDGNGVLAATMADIQTQNTQKLLGVIGEDAVVNLKIVIELLFIGIFPVVFPLFLLPKIGPEMVKGYLTGFLYLQLWGPMYVVLHKIMMYQAINKSLQATYMNGGTHAFTMLTMDPMAQANQDICTLAGSMMLMIPVLAGLITKGAMAVGAQGEALLGQFRSGAEAAGTSMANGNWSFGDTAVANHSADDINMHQHTTAPYNNVSATRTDVLGNGDTQIRWADGHVTDTFAQSAGAGEINYAKSFSDSLSTQSATVREAAENLQRSYTKGRSETEQAMKEVFTGSQSGTGTMSNFSHEDQKSISDAHSQIDGYLESHGYRTEQQKSEAWQKLNAGTFGVSADGTAGLQEFGLGAKAGVEGKATSTGQHSGEERHSGSEASASDRSMQDLYNTTFNKVSADRAMQQFDRTTSNYSGKRNVNSSTFASSASVNDTYNSMLSTSDRLSQEASKVLTNTAGLNSNMATAFMDFARNYYTKDGVLDRKAFGEFGNLSTQAGRDDFDRLGAMFLNQVTGNRVAEIMAETMHKPGSADLQLPKDVAGAEKNLGVSVPDQGQFHIATEKGFAGLAVPSSGIPGTAAGHNDAPNHQGGSGHGGSHNGYGFSGHKSSAGSKATDEGHHDQGGQNGLPAPISFHGGVSNIVDAGLAGHSMAHAVNAADIAAGRASTGGKIDTKPTIVGDTDETFQKMNHGQPWVMAGLKAAGPAGEVLDGIGQGAHMWNEYNKKQDGESGEPGSASDSTKHPTRRKE